MEICNSDTLVNLCNFSQYQSIVSSCFVPFQPEGRSENSEKVWTKLEGKLETRRVVNSSISRTRPSFALRLIGGTL